MNLRQQRDKLLRPYYDIKRFRMQLKFNDAYYYSMESLGLPGKQHDNSLRNGFYKALCFLIDTFFHRYPALFYRVLVATEYYCRVEEKTFILAKDGRLISIPVASV